MGACFSSQSAGDHTDNSHHQKSSANVVSADGEFRQYSLPVTVSQVLQSQALTLDSFFLCNSDRLYFDDYIPSLKPNDELEPAQIYFILSKVKLQYRLAGSDMAALAVKASVALDRINASNHRRKRKTRISPVLASDDDGDDQNSQSNRTVNNRAVINNNSAVKSSAGLGISSRSGSVRKLTRYSSRRAKLTVRSFRNKLTTIYEGSALYAT